MNCAQHNLRNLEELPLPYRNVFKQYPCFNVVQSAVLDDALKTDNSLVVSAPTGSGKTAVFEMAIVRLLMLADQSSNKKIIYISPTKALCQERLVDWHKKFSDFGLNCIAATSDSDDLDFKNFAQYNLIISTPEKWDVMTRRWRETRSLINSIGLFLIDEVHLLNADSRGSTLEVIVNRMKTAAVSLMPSQSQSPIRFIALSATIPNIEDIAEWIGAPFEAAKYFKFSEDVRPVLLNKVVLGYHFNPKTQSNFKFDMSLNYRLVALISKYSECKPTLIFCNTRKSVEMTANHLFSNLQIRLSQTQKEALKAISQQLSDGKLKQYVMYGIAFHHAGLVQDNRYLVEESFRQGQLPILVTTSTLAIGVNLPAHLVIVKSTKCYREGGYKDYDEVSIFQMIGRAGRNQFDNSATALILTSMQDKTKYEQMLGCTQMIESNLHKHLIEHLNAEVVLRTITDLDLAMRWLSSTFLYVRARKSPEQYKLLVGLSKEKIDKKLLEMCQRELNKLASAGMITLNQGIEIFPTVVGEIMAKYYVAFDTMKLFTQIIGSEILIQILAMISKCKEFSEIYLRTNDKKCLNLLNKNTTKESIRFPLTGRIKTVDMKVNCIIQAILGNLEIYDQSILCDSMKVMRNCERLAQCLIEYLETRKKCYNAMLNTIILAKCFRAKLWENSPYVSKQLSGVGRVISTLLMKAGKTTFKEISKTNPRHIEMIVGRKAPFGNTIVSEAQHLPEYVINMEKLGDTAQLTVTLLNPLDIQDKCTIDVDSAMTLLVGDSDNNIVLYEKYSHSYMLENPKISRSFNIENAQFIKANLISENWVGIDCCSKLDLCDNLFDKNEIRNKNSKQTFMDVYMKQVKKFTGPSKKNSLRNCARKTANTKTVEENAGLKEQVLETTGKAQQGVLGNENDISLKEKDMHSNLTECTTKKPEELKKRNVIVSKAIFHTVTKSKPEKKKLHRSESLQQFEDSSLDSQTTAILDKIMEDYSIVETEKVGEKRVGDTSASHLENDGNNNNKRGQYFTQDELFRNEIEVDNKNSTHAPDKPQDTLEESADDILDDKMFNTALFDRMFQKYKKPDSESDKSGNNRINPNIKSKKNMDFPDSTAEYNTFQTRICSPHPKKQKRDSDYGFSFDPFPQRSVKWRSPLAERISPRLQQFYFPPEGPPSAPRSSKENVRENNEIRLGTHDTSRSSLNLDIVDKPSIPSAKSSTKKKVNYRFPLSDQDCTEEQNDSFNKKLKELDGVGDWEDLGPVTKKKEAPKNNSFWSQPQVGKYYNQLVTNSQTKLEQNDLPNNLQEPKNVFPSTSEPIRNVEQDMATSVSFNFTQPSPREFNPNLSSVFLDRHFIDNAPPSIPERVNFIAPNRTYIQKYHYNPYLYEDRYQTSSYFVPQPQFSTQPMHSCRCCNHGSNGCSSINPYYNPYFCDPRSYRPEQYRSQINDIPENYIDHCLQQVGKMPLTFSNSHPRNFHFGPAVGSRFGCDKENVNPYSFCQNRATVPFNVEENTVKSPQHNLEHRANKLGQMFAHTPKRQLVHNPSALTWHQSQKFDLPRGSHPHNSLPPSTLTRMSNHDSFEERLDNIIVPQNQAFSFPAIGNQGSNQPFNSYHRE